MQMSNISANLKTNKVGISPVIQWLRHCLPVQELQVQSLVREVRSHMPHGQKTKTSNRSNILTDSTKTLKMVHHQKNLQKIKLNYNQKGIKI